MYKSLAKYNIPHELMYFSLVGYSGNEILLCPAAKNIGPDRKRYIEAVTKSYSFPKRVDSGITLVEKSILDNKFMVELIEPKEFSRIYFQCSKPMITVRIMNPELDSRYTYLLAVPQENFCDMVSTSDVISGKFQSEFSIEILGKEFFRLISVNDENYKKSVEVGKLLNGRKTTKWIPGHRYLFPNKSEVIYLGEYYVNTKYEPSLGAFYEYQKFGKRHLCVSLEEERDFDKEFPEENETISEYFSRITQAYISETISRYRSLIALPKCSRAVDLGEILIKDTINLDSIKKNLIDSNKEFLEDCSNLKYDKYDRIFEILGISDKNSLELSGYEELLKNSLNAKAEEVIISGWKNPRYYSGGDRDNPLTYLQHYPHILHGYQKIGISQEEAMKDFKVILDNAKSKYKIS